MSKRLGKGGRPPEKWPNLSTNQHKAPYFISCRSAWGREVESQKSGPTFHQQPQGLLRHLKSKRLGKGGRPTKKRPHPPTTTRLLIPFDLEALWGGRSTALPLPRKSGHTFPPTTARPLIPFDVEALGERKVEPWKSGHTFPPTTARPLISFDVEALGEGRSTHGKVGHTFPPTTTRPLL